MWFNLLLEASALTIYPQWSGSLVCAWKTGRSLLPSPSQESSASDSSWEVSSPGPSTGLTLKLGETEGRGIEGLHPLTLGSDVALQQSMLLQQVLCLHQVLPTLLRQQLSL